MPGRIRKLIGALFIVCFVLVYALVAMALAQALFVQSSPAWLQAIWYALLGLAWVLPLMPLVKWMAKDDRPISGD